MTFYCKHNFNSKPLNLSKDNLSKTTFLAWVQNRLMSEQTWLDANHILVLLVSKVSHALGLFNVRIPDHAAHRHRTLVDFTHGLHPDRLAFTSADANLDTDRLLLFRMHVDTVDLTGREINVFIVRGNLAIVGSINLINHRIPTESVDVALLWILSGMSIDGKVGVLETIEVEGIRAGVFYNKSVVRLVPSTLISSVRRQSVPSVLA